MDIIKEIEKIVSEYKGKAVKITEATTFGELGFDSLDTVDLMMQVEEKYSITFDDDMKIANMGDLIKKIQELKK